ncbi:MAG: hypothetical protein HY231_18355 [Acidobacteria bacterium]|nr:hypothetical protein [Acidobacteriota bacterium]
MKALYKWLVSTLAAPRALRLGLLLMLCLALPATVAYSQRDPDKEHLPKIKKPPRKPAAAKVSAKPKAASLSSQASKASPASSNAKVADAEKPPVSRPNTNAKTAAPAATETVATPPAPPPVLEKGAISIDIAALILSDFPDAEMQIRLDGVAVTAASKSSTRIEITEIPYGLHLFQFTHPTLAECKREIDIKAPLTYTNLTCSLTAGGLIVQSEPDAALLLDGKPLATIGKDGASAIVYLPLGEHTLKVSKLGYLTHNEVIYIDPGVNQKQITLVRQLNQN